MKIKIHDKNFSDPSVSKFGIPKYFEWYKGWEKVSKDNNIVVFTDTCLNLTEQYRTGNYYKVALILEPQVVDPYPYNYAKNYPDRFDLILTHHLNNPLKDFSNVGYYPNLMHWIDDSEIGLHVKSKEISIIASEKNWSEGHKLRHKIVDLYGGSDIDVYGRGYKRIESKLEALEDYMYSVVIENCKEPGYFSEKILDCFLTGTIPIYWGDPVIDNFFNTAGIVQAQTEEELYEILEESRYVDVANVGDEKVQGAIRENLERTQKLGIAEDYLWENYFQKLQR